MKARLASCGLAVRAAALIALSIIIVGCDKKGGKVSDSPAKAPQAPQNTRLQAELDRLAPVNHELGPDPRPLILSRKSPTRRDWALQTLEEGYAKTAHTNQLWDRAVHSAFAAFVDYSRVRATTASYQNLTNAITAATRLNCDDPMLGYMQVRYVLSDAAMNPEELALSYLKAHAAMWNSQYHPVFKFVSGYRAMVAARQADPRCNRRFLVSHVATAVEDLARDTNAPPEDVLEHAYSWLEYNYGRGWSESSLRFLLPLLEKNWAKEEGYYRIRGLAEVNVAWDKRGTGFANTVNEAGWKDFKQHLDEAEKYLQTAWQINPSNAQTAYLMMQVELGQGRGRDRMEQWFGRAMALAPNYWDATKLMSFYLEPRWYGSQEQALEFARSCVASTNWGGTVPLILPEVHHSLAKYYKLADSPEYWSRQEVWKDIESAYEKFFQLNPDDFGYRHNYARDAYLCGRYSEFLAQTRRFADGTNCAFFGGEAKFRQMLARAASDRAPER